MVNLYSSEFCMKSKTVETMLEKLYKGKLKSISIHTPEGMVGLGNLMIEKRATGDKVPVLVDEQGFVYEGLKGVLAFMQEQQAISYDGVASVESWMKIASHHEGEETANLYRDLVDEESKELDAEDERTVEHFKELLDTIWVLIGYGHALGYPMAEGFKELSKENFSKFTKVDGKFECNKRDDGKILKPKTFRKGDYASVFYA